MHNKFYLFLFVLIIIIFTPLYSLEKSRVQQIDWESIKGANSYRFLLKNEIGDILTQKDVKKNSIKLSLFPGNYQFKVVVINKFNKVSVETKWRLFKVLPAIQPLIRTISESVFYDNSDEIEFSIMVSNVNKKSRLRLHQKEHFSYQCNESQWNFSNNKESKQIKILVPTSELKLGRYTIEVENISGLKNSLVNCFEIKKSIMPNLIQMDLQAGYVSEVYKGIIIKGDNFQKGLSIQLVNGKQVINADMIKVNKDGTEIICSFNFNSFKSGDYSLTVENPSGLSSTLEAYFRLLTYDIASLLDFSFSYKIAGYISPYLEDGEFLYTGAQFRFAFGFGNLAFYNKPFLKDLGVEYDFTFYAGLDNENINDFFLIMTGFNLFWQSSFDFPANIQIKLGTGLTYAQMPNGITDGFYTQQSYTPYMKIGVNGLFEPVDKFLVDIGFATTPLFYFDRTAWLFEFSVGIGGSL